MKIQSVLISGFKNLSNVKVKFDSITALVALNNFGKSNFLKGIDYGLDFIKAPSDLKINLMSISDLIPINRNIEGENFKFEIEAITKEKHKEYRIHYGYEFKWKLDEEEEPKIVKEFLKIKLNEKGKKYTQLIKRNVKNALYKSSATGRCSSKIKVDPNELVVNKISAYDELYYIGLIDKVNSMTMYMETDMDTKKFYRPNFLVPKGLENEMIKTEDLSRVIFNLKKNSPGKFELLKDVFFQLFPNIEDIIVKKFSINPKEENQLPDDVPFIFTNTIYVLYVKDKNLTHPVDFSIMSDGAKRVFMILTKLIISRDANISLIAVEEPENCIHPSLFHAYIQIINQLLDGCKIIVTSHSPYIVSYLDPACIHVGLERTAGVAEFFSFKNTGKKQLERDAAYFNMSTGDYLFSMLADSDSEITNYLECEANE